MKGAFIALFFWSSVVLAQDLQLKEHPNQNAKSSFYTPISYVDSDGLRGIRASGAFKWSIVPIISQSWDGSNKWLALAVELIGSKLMPEKIIIVADEKTFILQTTDWEDDTRGNLCSFFQNEEAVRAIASANQLSVMVSASSVVAASFHPSDISVFGLMVKAYDNDVMHSSFSLGKNATPPKNPTTVIGSPKNRSSREKVMVIAHESLTTPYSWQIDGRISVSCSGNTCSGYYTLPTSGVQQIQGTVIRLLKSDSSVVIAKCVGKVNILSSIMVALDSMAVNDPNAPTVYRDCRMPGPNTIVEAEIRKDTVKIFMSESGGGNRRSETYSLIGILHPTVGLENLPVKPYIPPTE